MAECTNQKKRVKDSKPIHMGVAILQEAKLLFMEFMFFMFTHLQPGSFKNLYCDTDSIAIGKVDFFLVFIVYKLSTTKATTKTLPYDKINLKQIYKPASQKPSPIHLLWLKQELLLWLRTDLHKLFNALLVPRPLKTQFLLTQYTPSSPLGLQ